MRSAYLIKINLKWLLHYKALTRYYEMLVYYVRVILDGYCHL